jgi:hypothetical protein
MRSIREVEEAELSADTHKSVAVHRAVQSHFAIHAEELSVQFGSNVHTSRQYSGGMRLPTKSPKGRGKGRREEKRERERKREKGREGGGGERVREREMGREGV